MEYARLETFGSQRATGSLSRAALQQPTSVLGLVLGVLTDCTVGEGLQARARARTHST